MSIWRRPGELETTRFQALTSTERSFCRSRPADPRLPSLSESAKFNWDPVTAGKKGRQNPGECARRGREPKNRTIQLDHRGYGNQACGHDGAEQLNSAIRDRDTGRRTRYSENYTVSQEFLDEAFTAGA